MTGSFPAPGEIFAAPTIPHVLDRASATPNGVTFIDHEFEERSLSYSALQDGAMRAAAGLRKAGVEPGDRVCLLAPTSPECLAALFGAWRGGAVPIVLPLPRRRSDLEDFFADVVGRVAASGARAVVVADELLSPDVPLDGLGAPVAPLRELTTEAPLREPIRSSPDDVALLQFTSGTTRTSRAATLTHRNLVANLAACVEALGADAANDVVVSWLPLFHDMGLIGMLLGATSIGAPIVLEPTEEFLRRPGSWMDAISRYRGSITASPDFGYGLAARDLRARPRDLDLSSLRTAGDGGEPVDCETIEGFTTEAGRYGFRADALCPVYGLAESTLAVTVKRPGRPFSVAWVSRDELEASGRAVEAIPGHPESKALASCGPPVQGARVAILDAADAPLPEGQVGEICVQGPSVMRGYWQDPEATAEVLQGAWLHTGDLGFTGDDGTLYVCGRIKDVIIVGGRNLYAEDYEFWTERVPGVRRGNVIAFVVPGEERIIVVAETTVPAEEAEGVAREAIATLRDRLSRGPEEVVLVPPGVLPKTSSGKRRRGACREQYASGELSTLAVVGRST